MKAENIFTHRSRLDNQWVDWALYTGFLSLSWCVYHHDCAVCKLPLQHFHASVTQILIMTMMMTKFCHVHYWSTPSACNASSYENYRIYH